MSWRVSSVVGIADRLDDRPHYTRIADFGHNQHPPPKKKIRVLTHSVRVFTDVGWLLFSHILQMFNLTCHRMQELECL